ncbi:MAG: ATP phosphoribosyltransferase regulatory subunit, partial [Chlamydiales bacterium]|nr:ATP phosphoribosyltransferase regulatory subunit [Chlamydiales bacterium]
IPYEIDDRIVRGLDYYVKTVFEITSQDLGAQNALGGGGRYDGLLGSLGGPNLPGVGFATGIERILQAMVAQGVAQPKKRGPLIYFIPLGEEAKIKCFALTTLCRRQRLFAEIELHAKKMQTALQNAVRSAAMYAVVIGSKELNSNLISLKHLETRQTVEVSLDHLIDHLQGTIL